MEDPPLINPNWLTHPADQEVAIAGYKRVRELFATDALKPILIGPEYFPAPELGIDSDAEILDFIRKSFNTVFHAGSTCAMGRSEDPRAVVDSRAKVFGVQKLRVVDASALPFMIPGHPMATICKFPFPPC
jgi:choline dehydrogenase